MLYRDIIMTAHENLADLIKQPLVFVENFHASLAELYSEQRGVSYPDSDTSQTFTTAHNQRVTRSSRTMNLGTILDSAEKREEAGRYIASLKRQTKGKR